MTEDKYIIVGQGVAGSILSMKMTEAGMKHAVIDMPGLSSSSKVAAGLINPVVLKRLKLVRDASLFLSTAEPFYAKWENILNQRFYHRLDIHHIFQSQSEQNLWLEKSENPAFAKYLGNIDKHTSPLIKHTYGTGKMKGTAWVDTSGFLEAYKSSLLQRGVLSHRELTPTEATKITVTEKSKIIWCNGHLLRAAFPATKDFFSPTRGELLIIRSRDLPEDRIYHAGVFILPLGQNLFKVGATYHWDMMHDIPSPQGREMLEQELVKVFSGSYEIISHLAGVRPNIKDRKPVLGVWDNHHYLFNGLGSRGLLMAPYLADLFLQYLNGNQAIPEEYDVKRFT